ncbi:MAG: MRP family ATP-binding protein, partial [Chitinophagia bacterium]|nr:MRP family ATP-binding protein [Chitinophagia bacterium]
KGTPAVIDDEPVARASFMKLAQTVARNIAVRNLNMDPTKISELVD